MPVVEMKKANLASTPISNKMFVKSSNLFTTQLWYQSTLPNSVPLSVKTNSYTFGVVEHLANFYSLTGSREFLWKLSKSRWEVILFWLEPIRVSTAGVKMSSANLV